jgi:Leucine-rich repeat (LRR) protein
MLHRLACCVVVAACSLLAACQGYDFTVNEKVVYTPVPLFRGFATPDKSLKDCLDRAINDGVITAADQLTDLDCSFAGIENLEGLAQFRELRTLRLSANKLDNVVELSKFNLLEELYLDDNQIVDPVPLYHLPTLRRLDLSGNNTLECPSAGSLAHVKTVTLPLHCR